MNRNEALASLRVLLSVARCDGKLSLDERRVIEVAAQRAYAPAASPVDWASQKADLSRALAEITSPEGRRLTMKAAVAVAAVDGRVSPEEHAMLETIFEALSDGETPLDLSRAEEKYGDRMVAARGAIDHATQDFLHHVSSASHDGKLSQAAYEGLVNELEREKRERIRSVMSMLPPPPK